MDIASTASSEVCRINWIHKWGSVTSTQLVRSQLRCSFVTAPDIVMSDLPVFDLDLLTALNEGYAFETSGYAVVSIGVPYAPSKPDWDQGAVGWKLPAAWIPAA